MNTIEINRVEMNTIETAKLGSEIASIASRHQTLTPLAILGLPIETEKKADALLSDAFLSEDQLRTLACDFVQRVLPLYDRSAFGGDNRLKDFLYAGRRVAAGQESAASLSQMADETSTAAADVLESEPAWLTIQTCMNLALPNAEHAAKRTAYGARLAVGLSYSNQPTLRIYAERVEAEWQLGMIRHQLNI